jgi:hypothetical protein
VAGDDHDHHGRGDAGELLPVKGVWAFLFMASLMILFGGLAFLAVWLVRHSVEPYHAP